MIPTKDPLFWFVAGILLILVTKSLTDKNVQQRAVDAQDAAAVATILPIL